eukprot:SAG22_NODE_465_length_10181_cov_6.604444_11_plen_83_part_00
MVPLKRCLRQSLSVRSVQDAQTSKAPVQRYADSISAVFVPTIIVLSVLVFFFWYGLVLADSLPPDWTEQEVRALPVCPGPQP